MAHAFTPGLAVSPSTLVRKVRELPIAGDVLVTLGDVVQPEQEVARAFLPGDLHILRLPEKMGLEPFEVLNGLKVAQGDRVESGQLLCEHAGLFGWLKTRFVAPVGGTLELVSDRTGHLGLRTASRPIAVRAYIGGKVVAVEPGKSVSIETRAALMQGIFGVGGERLGNLCILSVDPAHPLQVSDLPEDCQQLVLVGGTAPSTEVLRRAAERGAVGMVVGSIDDMALRDYVGKDIGIALTGDEDVRMTLIITEGFGLIPMSARIPGLLRSFDGRRASVNGATQVRAGAVRPELIISDVSVVASSGGSELQPTGLAVGSAVRLIRVPYFGARGVVTALPSAVEEIPTGAFARVLRIRLEDGSVVTAPRANVELMGEH